MVLEIRLVVREMRRMMYEIRLVVREMRRQV